MDISIIIVNYNSSNLTIECINSILEQSVNLEYEIIVVDNYSTDLYFKSLEKKFGSQIKIIKNTKNLGFAKANNIGLTYAKGKFILFLNNDTLFHENTLSKVFQFAEDLKYPAMIGCKLLNKDGTLQYSTYQFPNLLNVIFSNLFLYLIFPKSKYFNRFYLMNRKIGYTIETEALSGAFIFAPAVIIREMNGFDERFYFYNEDTDLCFRFKKKYGKNIYFPETSITHLKGSSSNQDLWFKYKNRFISMIKYRQKHFNIYELALSNVFHEIGLCLRFPIVLIVGILTFNMKKIKISYYYLKSIFIYPPNEFKN